MPSIISRAHDDFILAFLTTPRPRQSVSLKSWLKLKPGYILPVEVHAQPYLDMKHDLRFVGLLKPVKELEIEENIV